jgi:uncharacterized membrane protein YcjF (UPF0283 family)
MAAAACFVRPMTQVVGGMRRPWGLLRLARLVLLAHGYVAGAVRTGASAGSPRRQVQAAGLRANAGSPALAALSAGCGG